MVYFHSNTLHRSAPNTSSRSRDVVLCAYNRADNDPLFEHHHPSYQPLEIVDDADLLGNGLVMHGESGTHHRCRLDHGGPIPRELREFMYDPES